MFLALRADTSYASFELKDGILCCTLKPDLILDLRTVGTIKAQRLRLVKDALYPTMVVIHPQYLHLEKAGFQFFGSEAGMAQTLAVAVVIKQPLRTLLGNLSGMFMKHLAPWRVFTNTAEARLWLFEYADVDLPSEADL